LVRGSGAALRSSYKKTRSIGGKPKRPWQMEDTREMDQKGEITVRREQRYGNPEGRLEPKGKKGHRGEKVQDQANSTDPCLCRTERAPLNVRTPTIGQRRGRSVTRNVGLQGTGPNGLTSSVCFLHEESVKITQNDHKNPSELQGERKETSAPPSNPTKNQVTRTPLPTTGGQDRVIPFPPRP